MRRSGMSLASFVVASSFFVVTAAAVGLFVSAANCAGPETSIDLPEPARAALLQKFPGAKIFEAVRNKGGLPIRYTVTLSHKNEDYEVVVTSRGKITEISKEIEPAALPAPVKAAIAAQYPKGEISEAYETIEFGVPRPLTYSVEIVNPNDETWEVVYDPKGTVVSKKRVAD